MSKISGHRSGSRRYGAVGPQSDWDYVLEDNPEARRFLKASGAIQTADYTLEPNGIMRSHWRYRHYACEVFLTKSEHQSNAAARLMWLFRWLRVFRSKTHRRDLWRACELLISTAFKVRSEYEKDRAVQLKAESRLRITPLK